MHELQQNRARSARNACAPQDDTARTRAIGRTVLGLAVATGFCGLLALAILAADATSALVAISSLVTPPVDMIPAGSRLLVAAGFLSSLMASLRGDRGSEPSVSNAQTVKSLEAELTEVRQLAEERKLALETADRAHAELVREVNHRIKNNLQVILSLLSLQTSRTQQPDARIALNEARQRISALALIHRHLYDSPDFQSLDFKSFASELLRHLSDVAGAGHPVTTRIVAPPIRITADQAVPVALLVTEAVSQAMSQGFPAGRSGEILVGLSEQDGTATLEIRDDGVPHANSTAASPGSLAALLIAGYVRQLQGRLEVQDRAPGTAVVVSFGWRPPEETQRSKVAVGA